MMNMDELQTGLIRKNIQNSLFRAIYTYFYDFDSVVSPEIDLPRAVLVSLREGIHSIKKAPGIFRAGEDAKTEAAGELKAGADAVINTYKKLIRYLKRLNFLNDLLNNCALFAEYEAELADSAVPPRFMDSCREFIDSARDEGGADYGPKRRRRMSKLMRCLPMRYTRGKCEEYIERAARMMFLDEPRLFADLFAKGISGEADLCKTAYEIESGEFARIGADLNRISAEYANSDDKDRHDELIEELRELLEKMRLAKEAMEYVFGMLNAAAAVFLFAPALDYLFGGDAVLKDVFYLLAEEDGEPGEPDSAEDRELFRENIRERFELAMGRLESELEGLEEEYARQLNQYGGKLPQKYQELQATLFAVEDLLIDGLDEAAEIYEFKDVESKDFDGVADHGYVREKARQIIEKFGELDAEPLKRRKFIKSHILSLFPYPFDEDEFYQYLYDSVNETSSGRQRLATLFRVSMMMDEEGFMEEPEEGEDYGDDCGEGYCECGGDCPGGHDHH